MAVLNDSQQGATWLIDRFGDLLACHCGGTLEPCRSEDELVCGSCAQKFDYANGILSFQTALEGDDRAQSIQQQEEQRRDKQAPFYDAAISASLPSWLEARRIRSALGSLRFDTAVEIGCGTGRFTVELSKHAKRIVAVDRSLLSLHHCRLKLLKKGHADRVLLIHSDANRIPVRPHAFDLAVMAQVLQHLPTDDLRRRLLANISETLNSSGSFIFSVYRWGKHEPFWRRKEGFHRGGIYFFRFTQEDLREVLSPAFDLQELDSCFGKLWVSIGTQKAEG